MQIQSDIDGIAAESDVCYAWPGGDSLKSPMGKQ
jgi:hypothetical protein